MVCDQNLEALFPFTDPRVDFDGQALLGRGTGTETWLRQRGVGFVAEKTYRAGQGFDIESDALKGLAWLLKQGDPTGFNYPCGLRLTLTRSLAGPKPIGYRIQYYPGRTVRDLVSPQSNVPAEVRERVRANYLASCARLQALAKPYAKALEAPVRDELTKLPWVWMLLPARLIEGLGRTEFVVPIAIKPDNIVVDPWTLEMTVFDPY